MNLYEFTRDDFAKVINDDRFLNGVKIAIEECFFPCDQSFKGDPQLLKTLLSLERNQLYEAIKEYPLPYISVCWTNERDLNTRQLLLDKAHDKLDPAWWCYIHQCEDLAIFILYPLCKLLFPTQEFYLYQSLYHTVILNRPIHEYSNDWKNITLTHNINQPLVFDLVSQLLHQDMEWIFKPSPNGCRENRFYQSHELVKWYTSNYSYNGMDITKYQKWFNTLPK